jgi:phage/plasmid-associated DNA primase
MTNFTAETIEKMANGSKEYYSLDNLPKEYKGVYELVNMLSVKRATEYNTWIRVCWALHTISPKLYNLFVHFSKKAPNFDESGCKNTWEKANHDGVNFTLSSLKNWAKEDNPKMYKQMYYDKLKELATKIENPNHDDIANIIFAMYNDIYKCVSIKNNFWFEYKYHRWVFIDQAYTLQERIASEVPKELFKINEFLWNDATDKMNVHRDDSIKQLANLCDLVLKLKDQNYGATLIKTCARKFYDPKFEESLDANPYLIGFENGVYDLKEMTFRCGMPDDRLTLSTGYDYNFTANSERLKEIVEFIKKIQPQENVREYVLKLFSNFLNGNNKQKKLNVFVGDGSNGKTKLLQLLIASLGQYAESDFADSINKPQFLGDKQGKRFINLSEPEDTFTIGDKQLIKLLYSGKVSTNGLSGESFEYTSQINTILVCNRIPKIDSNSHGKINITKFDSHFVHNSAQVNETKNNYLADLTIDNAKLKEWAPEFMWMLLNIYYNPKYEKSPEEGGLNEPEEVKKWTYNHMGSLNDYNSESEFEIIHNKKYDIFLQKMTTQNNSESERIAKLEIEVEKLHKCIGLLISKLSNIMSDVERIM